MRLQDYFGNDTRKHLEKVLKCECFSCTAKRVGFFLFVYVGDTTMAGKEETPEACVEEVEANVDFEEPTSGSGILGICTVKPKPIISWSFEAEGHAKKCVERYCDLSNGEIEQFFFKEEVEALGEFSEYVRRLNRIAFF